jgi:DNA replication protein
VTKFAGFPDGALEATPVPNLFFATVLPDVDSLAELKVTLHVLWRTRAGPRNPSWLALDELRRDQALLGGLASEPGGASAGLVAGLTGAVGRGTLLRATVVFADAEREVIAPNTNRGRRGLAQLKERSSALAAPSQPRPQAAPPSARSEIFTLYEENVGLVQPLIAEELRAAAELYPAAWIEDAFHQAVAYNRRNWRYVRRILERWATEGKDSSDATHGRRAGGPSAPAAKREWSQTYRRGEGLPDL